MADTTSKVSLAIFYRGRLLTKVVKDKNKMQVLEYYDIQAFMQSFQTLQREKSAFLIGIGMESCNLCLLTKLLLSRTITSVGSDRQSPDNPEIYLLWRDMMSPEELDILKLTITDFPTILGFLGHKLVCGWTGISLDADGTIPLTFGEELLASFADRIQDLTNKC